MAVYIMIKNDGTGTEDAANYDWTVHLNDRELARGRVEGHRRADGWQPLVRRLIDAAPIESRSIARRIAIQTADKLRVRSEPAAGRRIAQALEALEFAHGAIVDAAGPDDDAGAKVLQMIRAALTINGRTPPDLPKTSERQP